MKRLQAAVFFTIGIAMLSLLWSPSQAKQKNSSEQQKPKPARVVTEQQRSSLARAAPNSWTILVYLHADHNLEESSEADLQEMEKVGSGKNFNVIVQWDRLSEDGIQRIKVGKNRDDSELIEELEELDSDDPKTLADFVRWGVKAYPAQRYGLIIWDHGGQWNGIGGDETTDAGDLMDLNEIQAALQNSMNTVGIKQFDFLAFDTCLMGGLEPLVQLAPYSKIYIANPEIDYGDGWEYTADFGYLKANPGATMTEFAKKQNANWAAHHNTEISDIQNRAHAIYDTSKASAIAAASKEFSSALLDIWDANEQTLAKVRGRTIEYDMDNEDPHAPHDYVDLGDFASKLAAKNPRLKATSDKLNAAIDASIIAKTFGKNNAKARGLSVWLPSDRSSPPETDTLKAYFDLPSHDRTTWSSFVERWFGTLNANGAAPNIAIIGQKNLENPNAQNLAKVGFKVGDQDLNVAYASVGQQTGENFTYYGDLWFKTIDPGAYNATWNGSLPNISDGTQSSIFPGFYQDADTTLLYATAKVQSKKSRKPFEVTLVLDTNSNRIVSALDESGTSPKRIMLEPGSSLEMQFLRYDAKTNKITLSSSGITLTVPADGLNGFVIAQTRVPKGEYALTVGAVDWAGNDNFEDSKVTIR
jgi:hypothetical protein